MPTAPYTAALDALEPRARRASVGGIDTAWWEYGDRDAPAITFVHGFRGDHHGLTAIAAHLPEYRILIPDLPGFGDSAPFAPGADTQDYALWLHAFHTAYAPESSVLGHSFGSIVVSAAAPRLTAPHLVLVNPIARHATQGFGALGTGITRLYYRAAEALPERAGLALLRSPLIVRGMSEVMATTRDPQLRAWIHAQHAQHFSSFASRESVSDAFRASVDHDIQRFAGGVRQPTLLVAGDRDSIAPLATVQALAQELPDAELVVLQGAGHLTHYERPARVASEMRRWLDARAR